MKKISTNNDSAPRYTVERARFAVADEEKICYIILENGLPATEVNKHLLVRQLRRSRPVSTSAYNLCRYLNTLDALGIEMIDVTLSTIYNYLFEAYVDDGKSYKTITTYINDISALYESLALRNYKLDESLYRPRADSGVRIKYSRKDPSLTMISALRKEFLPKKVSNDSVYTKWYSGEELEAISSELPLVHRCIFWDTVFTGHRVDSALSVTMETINLRKRWISPTRTKTGKSHVSVVPQFLADMIETYIIEERSKIVTRTGSSCKYLFLNRDGNPVSYATYNAALKRAGEQVGLKNPNLNLQDLHTHAGRSTFAAVLRTYQLDKRRKGEETLTDADFCNLMDWKSMQCLENYDIATRSQEVSPLLSSFFMQFFGIAGINRSQPIEFE